MKKSEAFCYKCKYKKTCKGICPDLEIYLRELEKGNRGETAKFPDYFEKYRGVAGEYFKEELTQESWERRCVIVKEAIQYFKSFKSQALEYFLVWRYVVEEELSQQKISELTGISQQHISRMIMKIKNRKEGFQ